MLENVPKAVKRVIQATTIATAALVGVGIEKRINDKDIDMDTDIIVMPTMTIHGGESHHQHTEAPRSYLEGEELGKLEALMNQVFSHVLKESGYNYVRLEHTTTPTPSGEEVYRITFKSHADGINRLPLVSAEHSVSLGKDIASNKYKVYEAISEAIRSNLLKDKEDIPKKDIQV